MANKPLFCPEQLKPRALYVTTELNWPALLSLSTFSVLLCGNNLSMWTAHTPLLKSTKPTLSCISDS